MNGGLDYEKKKCDHGCAVQSLSYRGKRGSGYGGFHQSGDSGSGPDPGSEEYNDAVFQGECQ